MTDLICRQVQKASATIGPAIHKLPSSVGFDLLDFDPEGGRFGAAFGAACRFIFPALAIQPQAFALVGMAAFFTGVVRAPVTGIVLVVEMTGNVTMLLPMLGACFVAMLLPMLLRTPPIYDSLREHTLRLERQIRRR
jgi:CIC family chloride channel protein